MFGAVCAQRLIEKGYTVLVIDKRNHIGGNVYTENVGGINVHVYGAHIFHTSNELVWNYINKFCSFNNFINSPIANYNGEIYNLPFNMNTFVKIWPDINSVDDAKNHIEEEKKRYGVASPSNLEEQAINMVGKTIYDKLIKEYTEKQWGKRCVDLPSFIIKRIPLRFEFNNNYFDDKYQGIPIGGYTRIIEKMLSGAHVILNCDFIKEKNKYLHIANKIIYTGQIDEFFDYCYGFLEYRSLKFENENLPLSNFQNNAVVNYTSNAVMYTRIIEHKHFERADTKFTIITKEYPKTWKKGF